MEEPSEAAVATALLDAQTKAQSLFAEIKRQGIIRAGVAESKINAEIYELAERKFGVTRHWHKRIVRAGRNTLAPYEENPPDLTVTDDDIVFLDLGPVFEAWEADFGRTYVIGKDPFKQKLCRDIEEASVPASGTSSNVLTSPPRNFTSTLVTSHSSAAGNMAGRSRDISLASSHTKKSQATKLHSMFIPGIPTVCACRALRGACGIGFSRSTLSIAPARSAVFTRNCSRSDKTCCW